MKNISINFSSGTIILTAFLCILKLTGVLTISWWWCFCLIWLPFALLLGLVILFVAIVIPFVLIELLISLLKNR